jgi:DNA-binding NtrC family response regulator
VNDASTALGQFHEEKQRLVEEFERAYLTRVLAESARNISRASRSSGLSRKHLRTLMTKYGLVADGSAGGRYGTDAETVIQASVSAP